MYMPAQNKRETYTTKLSELARVNILNEGLLEEVNRCIKLYEDKIITKPQLTKFYKNITKQINYETKIKQLSDERSHINDMYKILYIKTEYIDILDSVSVTTEEPISDSEPAYTYDDSLIDNIYTYKYDDDDSVIDNTYKYDEVEVSSPKIKQSFKFNPDLFNIILS